MTSVLTAQGCRIRWVFAAAGAVTLLIAMVTVSFKCIQAALANPVKSLRTE